MTRTRILKATVALWLSTTAACADSHTGLMPHPAAAPTTTISAASTGGDPEPVFPVSIHSAQTEVRNYVLNSPTAGLIGRMQYDSYHARISAKASVTGSTGSFAQDFFPQEKNTFWAFWNQSFEADWDMPLPDWCGSTVRAEMKFEVWWMYSGGWSMDSEDAYDDSQYSQKDCGDAGEDPPSDGGGGRGSDTTVRCYTYTVDHYWYYPDTDTYEYRYTDTHTWCEQAST